MKFDQLYQQLYFALIFCYIFHKSLKIAADDIVLIYIILLILGYAFLVTWITAFVMVVVHERVPDSKRYPPLPDVFLDNVPHISWAFFACEVTGSLLFTVWVCVLIVHKSR